MHAHMHAQTHTRQNIGFITFVVSGWVRRFCQIDIDHLDEKEMLSLYQELLSQDSMCCGITRSLILLQASVATWTTRELCNCTSVSMYALISPQLLPLRG